jgi:ElaB/YqjD/DUF883 family membrane-anchored ribosome-binding protein
MDHLDPSRYPESTNSPLPSRPEPAQQRLIGDLQQVIDNAEDLLNCTDGARDGASRSARKKVAQRLAADKYYLLRLLEPLLERMIAATHEASRQHNDSTGEARLLRAFR